MSWNSNLYDLLTWWLTGISIGTIAVLNASDKLVAAGFIIPYIPDLLVPFIVICFVGMDAMCFLAMDAIWRFMRLLLGLAGRSILVDRFYSWLLKSIYVGSGKNVKLLYFNSYLSLTKRKEDDL